MRRFLAGVVFALAVDGCTLPQQLFFAILPDETIPILFANLKGLETPVQERLLDLERKQDWSGILVLADEALAKDPRSPEWWFVKGHVLAQLTRWPEAATAYAEAVQFNPLELDGWFRLARAQHLSGYKDRSINTLERSLQVSRESSTTFFLLGELHRELGNSRAAIPAYREALRLQPDLPGAWFGLGLIAGAEGRLGERDAIIERLKTLAPELAKQLADGR
ncbi:MAG: tetratricopeptide repeat protein [Burkholderiales bacterium]